VKKNFAQKLHFILVKPLKFQETFLEKFLVSGFGAEAPTDNTQKNANFSAFFIFHDILELPFQTLL